MANNFKPWVDTPTAGQQVQSASVFASDAQRVAGFKAGDPASALRVNSALRQANIVIAGLMQFCDEAETLPDELSLLSTVTQVKNAIKASVEALHNITLTSAKNYTDTRETAINTTITNVQTQVTGNKNDITTLIGRVDEHDEEIVGLSGGTSTLTTRVGTLETEMNTAQADITNLQSCYETNLTTESWLGSTGNYNFSIPATTHKRGIRPRVHTYVDGEETYDSPEIDFTTGDVIVYSNASIALKVLIY